MSKSEMKAILKKKSNKIPPIPEGWRHVSGEWRTGFVISRIEDNSRFVWVPVNDLKQNGTTNGILFNKRYGRRRFAERINLMEYKETQKSTFVKFGQQMYSVEKYGGFYISVYTISKGQNERPVSVSDDEPWTNVSWYDALCISEEFCQTWDGNVESHLLYGAEYDSCLEWQMKILCTKTEQASKENDLLCEWTQEQCIESEFAIYRNAQKKRSFEKKTYRSPKLGFRIALKIE